MSNEADVTNPLSESLDAVRIDEGMPVDCTDGPWGDVADVIIDPVQRTVTHLVVQPHGRHHQSRLVPIDAVIACGDRLTLSWTTEGVRNAPAVQRTSSTRDRTLPESTEGWDVGVSETIPWSPDPLSSATEFGYNLDADWIAATTYDRIPSGTAELRRASEVVSSDGHIVGHVDGIIVDRNDGITYIVLGRGHLWGHREITIPVGDIKSVSTDRIQLRVTRDAVGAYPTETFDVADFVQRIDTHEGARRG